MIAITNLQKMMGQRVLFENVSFNLNRGERYGLVGANGSGKTTLIRILSGEEPASDGRVHIPKDVTWGALKQDQFMNDHEIIIESVMSGDKLVYQAMLERDKLLSTETPDAHRLDELLEIIGQNDGYTLKSRSAEILVGLGIEISVHEQPLSALSGGFKLRVLFAQVLISSPDMLMLDEPTNHLDIVTIRWLEKYLVNFKGAVLVISHDRRFLDRVCTHILDIDYGTVTPYTGNYSAFEISKQLIRAQKEAELANIQAVIAHKQSFVDRFGAKASKARQAQSRIKQIEKIEIPELKTSSRQYPTFQFVQKRPSGREILKVEGLSKSYGDKKVLSNLSVDIRRGDRVAIIGPNGIGKSTLLKILNSQVNADEGKFVWGHEAQLGYFAQDHDADIKKTKGTAQQWLWQFCPEQALGFVRSFLGRVLFSGDDALKSISHLSGGEIARLDLARLMILKPNVLILDEPTNHLDVETIESLVSALKAFEGTLLFVSHDRWFVSELATRIVEITPKGVSDYKGTFEEYLSASGDDHLDAQALIKKSKKEQNWESTNKEDRKKQFVDNKQKRSDKRKIEVELEKVTQQIAQLESRQKEVETKFCLPDFFEKTPIADVKKLQNEQEQLSSQLQDLVQKWEDLEKALLEE